MAKSVWERVEAASLRARLIEFRSQRLEGPHTDQEPGPN